MRQRNTSGSVLVCPEAGRNIGPGEEIEYPSLITGCEPVPDEPAPKPAVKAKTAATGEGAGA